MKPRDIPRDFFVFVVFALFVFQSTGTVVLSSGGLFIGHANSHRLGQFQRQDGSLRSP